MLTSDHLQGLATLLQKPQVRESLRTVMKELLAFLDATEPAPPPVPIQIPALTQPLPKKIEKDPDALRPTVSLRALTLGTAGAVRVEINDNGVVHEETRSLPAAAASSDYSEFTTDEELDLTLIMERCRLKASACRFTTSRRARLLAGDDLREFAEEHHSFINSGRATKNCFLWMLEPWMTLPSDDHMNVLAGLYDTLAHACELVRELEDHKHPGLLTGMNMMAEAQSAIRSHLILHFVRRNEQDQNDAFKWLRKTTVMMNTFIDRYMRADDMADGGKWENLQSRIIKMKETVGLQKKMDAERKRLLGKVKYHTKRVQAGGTEDDWNKITESVESLIMYGLPASNAELRDLITPMIDLIPQGVELGHGMTAVLAEIDRFIEITADVEEASPVVEKCAPAVAKVANLLKGKRLLLVGGTRRPKSQEALQAAFGLEEMIWPTTRKHESLDKFASDAKRADLVLMAIRWSSHSFGDLKAQCDQQGTPFVRLKAGYNPNQVAQAILAQAGEVLMSKAGT